MDQNKNEDKRKKLILELFHDSMYVPMKKKELAQFMQVSKEMRDEFDALIEEMLDEKLIMSTQKGKLLLYHESVVKDGSKKKNSPNQILTGTYIGNQRGFGFVEVEGMEEDYFIPEGMNKGAVHNDQVEIEVNAVQTGKRKEARVISIIERNNDPIVGTYQKSKNFGFVIPDNVKLPEDIFIPIERSKGAVTGHKVVVEITNYGDDKHKPEGKITQILGHANDPGVDILSIALAFGIPTQFPEKVMHQAEGVEPKVSDADRLGRTDLRDLKMVTIDGEDAKDLDDAVSLEMKDDLYELGVHIADVSNYVQENSALDMEALLRGTSVYLADRVIPMLPHALSNGICSLNQGEDRLALSCIMDIDEKGTVRDYRIEETVICVNHRMNYTDVAKIIDDHDEEIMAKYEEFVPIFEQMKVLADILRKKRKERGSIDFDFPETKLILDSQGKPIEIKPYERNSATKLIEDFMLIANETIAQNFFWQEIPFLYRTHETPDEEKIKKLRLFIKNFGYTMKTSNDEIHPKELQKLLTRIEGSKEESLISRLTLRSMKQAKYSTECTGHFGLACEYYTHFTSPIRRYPDLQIHRIIKDQIRKRLSPAKISHYEEILDGVAHQASVTERRADETERETVKLKKAEYMKQHMYEVFEGVISGVTNWGIYVELPNTVEGLVHVSSIAGDYYRYDEANYELIGEGTGKTFKLGEHIKVMVHGVDLATRTIDFILADFEEGDAIHDFYKNGRNALNN